MTDEEIEARMARCSSLLTEYIAEAKPLAEELARRKSLAVFGEEGCYMGDLGCWEAGKDTICLHITVKGEAKKGSFVSAKADDAFYEKVSAFEDAVTRPLERKFNCNPSISGFY